MMITYQAEKFEDCFCDVEALFYDHWLEIAENKDTVPFDPDYEKYFILERSNMLRCFSARCGDEIIGYFVSFVQPHIHYKTTVYAMNDVVYIKPSYRGGTVGYRLFKNAMLDLKAIGVNRLVMHMKIKYEFRSLLTKLGFKQVEENWEIGL